jgi:hypothetical protein
VIEPDNVVQTVTELRRKDLLDLFHRIGAVILVDKADGFTLGFTHPGVGGHHQHHVAEVRLAPVVVGQRPVVHHLQQDVEHVRCAFSISSSSSTACGCLITASVSRPP